MISWIATYSIIFISVLVSFLPRPVLISFVSLSFVIDSNRLLFKNYEQLSKLPKANKRMIQAHAITAIGIIIGYIWHGYLSGRMISEIHLFSIVLVLLYIPALLPPLQTKIEENV